MEAAAAAMAEAMLALAEAEADWGNAAGEPANEDVGVGLGLSRMYFP